MRPQVWLKPGMVIIYGAFIDAAPHKHHAIQLIWPNEHARCQLNNTLVTQPVIIKSQIEHQLQLEAGWLLLIEPQSDLGQALVEKLAYGHEHKTMLNVNILKPPSMSLSSLSANHLLHSDEYAHYLQPLFEALNLEKKLLNINANAVVEPRIQQLLNMLDKCLQGDCLKPAHWRAATVAKQLALSESRFLHLFRHEMGIAWRPFLLWRRMICALQAMLNKASATEAAYRAGFSDSAHLSRTFRKHFGMSIRQASALFKVSADQPN